MFGFGKGKKIEKLIDAIGSTFSGQMMILPISPEELISLSKHDKLISGYIMGFQLHIISQSPFNEKDHKGILLDSYFNLFGSYDAQEVIDFAFSSAGDKLFNSGVALGIQDIINFSKDPMDAPLSLIRILNEENQGDGIPFWLAS